MGDLNDLLEGFVDTHIHAGPDLSPREFESWDLVQHAKEHNFKAVVVKNHYMPSMGYTRVIQDHYPDSNIRIFGSLVLNNSVGGLNPQAVERAIHFGAKLFWLPTISAAHHHKKHKAAGFPKQKPAPRVKDTPIECLDTNGRLTSSLEEVLSVLSDHPDVVLATGHVSPQEVNAVVHRAKELGIQRIIITHPLFLVGAGMGELKDWAKLGAYVEFTAINSFPESMLYTLPPAKIAEVIKTVGADSIIISSDAGFKDNGWPFENVGKVLELLSAEGIADDDLRKLVADNPAKLLGV